MVAMDRIRGQARSHRDLQWPQNWAWRNSNVGAGLLAKAIQQAKKLFTRSIMRRGTS
jgi:hypothetical protein